MLESPDDNLHISTRFRPHTLWLPYLHTIFHLLRSRLNNQRRATVLLLRGFVYLGGCRHSWGRTTHSSRQASRSGWVTDGDPGRPSLSDRLSLLTFSAARLRGILVDRHTPAFGLVVLQRDGSRMSNGLCRPFSCKFHRVFFVLE